MYTCMDSLVNYHNLLRHMVIFHFAEASKQNNPSSPPLQEQLCGGGWSTTGIGKQYSDATWSTWWYTENHGKTMGKP